MLAALSGHQCAGNMHWEVMASTKQNKKTLANVYAPSSGDHPELLGWLSWYSVGIELQRPMVRTLSRAQEQFVKVFPSQKYNADLSVCPTIVCIRTHENTPTQSWECYGPRGKAGI